MASRTDVVGALDEYLDIDAIADAALNGLQVEGKEEVVRVALAVDAAQVTIESAVDSDCQLLVVHHGLFWGPQVPLSGVVGRRVRACFVADLSVYAAHLPLDAHAEVGNNVLLAERLGARVDGAFADIGALASFEEAIEVGALAGRLAAAGCDEPLIWSFGGEKIRRIAVVTGRGCSALDDAVDAGADCFVTGEPVQEAYHAARDHGIHCLFGGHYATETFGVRALGDWLVQEFDVEAVWIDHPTGI
ncbi:MAG: Nif3-like dinuclear metal center hexameric protein [Acidobacteria bacterium]|nr:Nif3-like dinuclear metal center hexameric protein [Acidobacteriota bacterium]